MQCTADDAFDLTLAKFFCLAKSPGKGMEVHGQNAYCSTEESGASHRCDIAVLHRSFIVIA